MQGIVAVAVAQFEWDLLIECTPSGIVRAKAAVKRFGCPLSLSPEQQHLARDMLAEGASISAVARELNTTRQTILRFNNSELQKR